MDYVLAGAQVLLNGKLKSEDISISNGKIGFGTKGKKLDCSNMIILPGLIDAHVHFRCPGAEQKEDWQHASRAAVSGGVTSVLDMPNNNPSATTIQAIKAKKAIAKGSLCNYGFFIGATSSNLKEIERYNGPVKLYFGSTTGSLLLNKEQAIRDLFELSEEKGFAVAVHAESQPLMEKNQKLHNEHNQIRDENVETEAVKQLLSMHKDYKNRLHFCHLSSLDSLALVKRSRNATAEAAPHHLFLSQESAAALGPLAKTNPPIRLEKTRAALFKAFKEGLFDTIATDHAPHTLQEKSSQNPPSGVPGIENLLALLLNSQIPFQLIAKTASINPARIFGIENKGQIKEGFDADLAIIDPTLEKTVENSKQYTKCKWSPYDGLSLKGWPVMTIVNGQLIFNNGKFTQTAAKPLDFNSF